MLSDYEGDIAVVGLGVGGVCGEEGIRNGEERVKDWGGERGEEGGRLERRSERRSYRQRENSNGIFVLNA